MTKIKNNKTLVIVGAILTLALGFNGFGLFTSAKDVQDTVNKVANEKIDANDKLDDGKYFGKTEGVALQTDVKNMKEDVTEIRGDVKEMAQQVTQTLILLNKIDTKLDYYKDSI